MPSTFSWLDTSEHDRRRALEVVDLLSLRDTRDELGIGTIRDALADRLAPGTSTIQTRARYFLFVPWIYLELERRNTAAARVAEAARRLELDLGATLSQAEDNEGALGKRAGKALKRLPSSVYWAGLGVLGIRLFPGSQDRYQRAFGARDAPREDGDLEAPTAHWHPRIPRAPESFPHEATFALTPEEAGYLLDRFRQRAPGSFVTHLLDSGEIHMDARFPWEHPAAATARPRLRESLEHARCFSEAMHGAALLYNLLLAEAVPNDLWIERYRGLFATWTALVEERRGALERWDRGRFWAEVHSVNARVPAPSRRFAEDWVEKLLAAPDAGALAESENARELIRRREHHLKRRRARLRHREYLEGWHGAAGAARLDYRWSEVRTHVRDVLTGLGDAEPGAEPDVGAMAS